MSLLELKNKAGAELTISDYEAAKAELSKINNTLVFNHFVTDQPCLMVNFTVEVKNGGLITESKKIGKLIDIVTSDTSSDFAQQATAVRHAENEVKSQKAAAIAKVKAAAKAEKNKITRNGETVSLADTIAHLAQNNDDRYESRFLANIAGKSRLTGRQHNFLAKLARARGYSLNDKAVKAKAKSSNDYCDHGDLGSLGHTHGHTVKCDFCGQAAVVW